MTIGTDIAAALPELRAQAESLHQDTFAVFRKNGVATDPATYEERPTFATVHAAVKGKIQFTDLRPSEAPIPGAVVVETYAQWHTSVSVLGVLTDDEIECIAVGPLGDPDMVGKRMRIAGPFLKSIATARRFPIEEVS